MVVVCVCVCGVCVAGCAWGGGNADMQGVNMEWQQSVYMLYSV